MVKNIKEVKAAMRKKAKISKQAMAKKVVANVKSNSQYISKTEETANKLYGVFETQSKIFGESELKTVSASLIKIKGCVNKRYAKTLNDLKTAIALNLPNSKLISQIEDLTGLHSKLAMLKVQAEASLAEDDDTLEVDSTGFVIETAEEVASEDEGINANEDIVSEDTIAEETTAEETVAEDIVSEDIAAEDTIAEETVAEGEDILNEAEDVENLDELTEENEEDLVVEDEEIGEETEIEDIELEDEGIDDFVTNEILTDEEMGVLEEEPENEEEEITSSIKAKKLKTAKKIKNNTDTAEDGMLSQLFEGF